MSIRDRLAKAKGKGVSDDAAIAAAQIYGSIRSEVDRKSKEELRKEVNSELEAKYSKIINDLKSEVINLKSEMKSDKAENMAEKRIAESLKIASDEKIQSLKQELSDLKTVIREKAQSVAVNKQELAEKTQVLKDEVKQGQMKINKLELQIATLTGKLSEKKPSKAKPAPMMTPTKIPAFKFDPVRGQDGRIVSVTATPIGGN